MPQSLAKILIHVVFSTKNRQPLIVPPVRDEMQAYLIGALGELQSPSLRLNAQPDHVHILCNLSRRLCSADLVERVKTSTSRWVKTKGDAFREFHWQRGYGVWSVSESMADAVMKYIAEQEQHHRRYTFEHEYRRLLELHKMAFDEKYAWD